MSNKPIAIFAFTAAAVALLAIAAIAAPGKVEQDATFYQLDAHYHQLPQSLVDRLMKDPPPAPDRHSTYWCYGPKDTTEEGTGYCVCWGDAACRELANLGVCEAKLGIIRLGTGVCRSQVETVIVG